MAEPTHIRILPVQTQRDRKTFIHFPYQLYQSSDTWVPPLLVQQKQLFDKEHLFWKQNPHQFFLAYKNGRCAGRIAVFVNREHNRYYGTKDGFFGFLEAEHDQNVFDQLLRAAEEYLSSTGCRKVIGPMNPSIHYELGILVDGFEAPPFIMLTHNYPYYDQLIGGSGYAKLKDFYSYRMNAYRYVPTQKMERVGNLLQKRYNIRLRTPDMNCFEKELKLLHSIYNDAFLDHWGFVPIPEEEFHLLAKDMKTIIDPRMVLIAEVNGIPAAFLLCVPNFNEILIRIGNGRLFPFGIFRILAGKKNRKSIRVITVAVKKAYQHMGLGALLYPEIMKRALHCRYHDCELSWVVEDNFVMNQIARDVGGTPYKTYRLYAKPL